MIFTIRCPHCQTTARVEDEVLGRKIRCKDCETVFVAKATEDATPPASKKSTSITPKSSTNVEPSRPKATRDYDEDDDFSRPARSKPVARDYDDEDDDYEERPRRRKRKKSSNNGLYIGLGVGGGVLVLVIILAVTLGGKSDDSNGFDNPKEIVKSNPVNPGIPLDGKNNSFFGGQGGQGGKNSGIPLDGKGNTPLGPDGLGGGDLGIREPGEPNIPEADRKLFTLWNAQIKTVGGEIILQFNFRRKNLTERPGMMYVLMTGNGEQLVVDMSKGNTTPDLFEKNGTVIEKFVRGNGGGPFGPYGPSGKDFGKTKMGGGPGAVPRAMPKFGKGSKFWIAVAGPPPKGSGPFAGASPGVALSNIADLISEP